MRHLRSATRGLLLLAASGGATLLSSCAEECFTNACCQDHPERCGDGAADPTDSGGTSDSTDGADGGSDGGDGTGGTTTCGGEQIACDTRDIFAAECESCHGDGDYLGGVNFILSAERLVQSGLVVPGEPDASGLYIKVFHGQMPPTGALPDDQTATVRQWIEAGCPDWDATLEPREFYTLERIFELMVDDLRNDEQVAPSDRPTTRYISLAHLYSAGRTEVSDDELKTYEKGISKLLNSLSWNGEIKRPTVVHSAEGVPILLRINLKHYNWHAGDPDGDPVDGWEHLIKGYPYAFPLSAFDEDGYFDDAMSLTGSRMPLVFGDWLVHKASQPPLYNEILNLPNNASDFLDLFGHTPSPYIRAAFEDSGVSQNNRMIERHAAGEGYCWISYDFAAPTSPDDDGILFDTTPLDFVEDGGEGFCTLPNRLQAYMLYDVSGQFLDEGPIDVVQARDGSTVTNGLDCFECHDRGIITKSDDMRAHADYLESRSLIGAAEHTELTETHVEASELQATYARDMERYLEAQDATGATIAYDSDDPTQSADPIHRLSREFEAEMSIARVAAEIGVTVDVLETKLPHLPDHLVGLLITLGGGGSVDRELFLLGVRDLYCFVKDSDQPTCDALPDACGPSGLPCPTGYTCIDGTLGDPELETDVDGDGTIDDLGACVESSDYARSDR